LPNVREHIARAHAARGVVVPLAKRTAKAQRAPRTFAHGRQSQVETLRRRW
jgi:hypothetical protein